MEPGRRIEAEAGRFHTASESRIAPCLVMGRCGPSPISLGRPCITLKTLRNRFDGNCNKYFCLLPASPFQLLPITCTTLYDTILYYTILYYPILYYTVLSYTILYYAILYFYPFQLLPITSGRASALAASRARGD